MIAYADILCYYYPLVNHLLNNPLQKMKFPPGTYTQIPHHLLHGKNPHEQTIMLWCFRYTNDAGEFWPGFETLAEHSGMSYRQVRRIMKNLRDSGIIKVMQNDARKQLTFTWSSAHLWRTISPVEGTISPMVGDYQSCVQGTISPIKQPIKQPNYNLSAEKKRLSKIKDEKPTKKISEIKGASAVVRQVRKSIEDREKARNNCQHYDEENVFYKTALTCTKEELLDLSEKGMWNIYNKSKDIEAGLAIPIPKKRESAEREEIKSAIMRRRASLSNLQTSPHDELVKEALERECKELENKLKVTK